MKAKDLRNSVLQLAVQGKLVPQDSNDESASVLLERIKAEKARLIKEKEIRKQEPLAPISEDEIPFDIPDSWEWVRLGDICQVNPRNQLDNNLDVSFIPMALIEDKYKNSHSSEVRKWVKIKSGYTHFKEGDICIAKITPCFENRKSSILYNLKNGYGAGTTELHILRPYTIELIKKYLLWFVKTEQFINDGTSTFTGTAGQQRIGKDFIKNYPFPLPSFAEQQRIVEKLEQIMPLIDEYEKLETELTKLETEFPEKLKKSILQYAVQGKLVEQISDNEPASLLLQRIKGEKDKLIKEKIIRKQKPLPPITEDEIPFDIPDCWEWVRLGEICQINPRNKLDKDMDVSFIPMALIDDKYNNSHSSEVKKWEKVKSGYTHFKEGDICIAKITPCFENKKSAILCNLKNGYGAGTTELHILRPYTNKLNKKYLLWFVKTEQFINDGTSTFTGTAGQQRIGKDFVQNYPFPLPPIVEQQRIVQRIDELLSLCGVLLDEKALRARKVRKQIDNVTEFPQGSNDEDTEIVFAARGDANKTDLDIAEEIFNGLFDDK